MHAWYIALCWVMCRITNPLEHKEWETSPWYDDMFRIRALRKWKQKWLALKSTEQEGICGGAQVLRAWMLLASPVQGFFFIGSHFRVVAENSSCSYPETDDLLCFTQNHMPVSGGSMLWVEGTGGRQSPEGFIARVFIEYPLSSCQVPRVSLGHRFPSAMQMTIPMGVLFFYMLFFYYMVLLFDNQMYL